MRRFVRRYIFIITIVIIGITGSAYVESYFEISKNLDIFSSVYREINVSYVEETNPGKLIKTGIDAMLGSLDPYTNYIPEAEIEDYKFMTTHEYGGIGAMIGTRNNEVMITEPYENSPAVKAGLRAGDVILKVGNIDAKGKNSSELSDLLRGESGTSVNVTIYRPATEERIETTIVREKIKLDDVPYFGMLDDEVGYISLRGFTQTASKEVKSAYETLKQERGMKKLVLDLRGNGGGLLNEAVNIVNFFVKKGELVVETKGKLKEHYSVHRALNSPLDLDIPLVVMIDESSASASEIVSGTLQDLDRAVVVGQSSFGKGLVQTTTDLSYNSILKLTIAKYYTPSGRCIQRIDYGKRDASGRATEIPDSLLHIFKTRNGRMVKDGAGIMPDIEVSIDQYSSLLATLLNENLIFDFATRYYFTHDSIGNPEIFEIDEATFNDFVDFVVQHDFEYRTSSSEVMKELEKVIKEEAFWSEAEASFQALSVSLERNKKEDLYKFKDEIKVVLENEIASRYFYSNGRVRAFMKHDPEIQTALQVLHNKERYDSVLEGTCEDCLIKKG